MLNFAAIITLIIVLGTGLSAFVIVAVKVSPLWGCLLLMANLLGQICYSTLSNMEKEERKDG